MATKRGLSRFASAMQNADGGSDLPQKTIQPVASGLLAPSAVSPSRMTLDELLKRNVAGQQILDPLSKAAGIADWQYDAGGVDESGNPLNLGVADAQKLAGLKDYTFDWKDTGSANTGTLTAYDPTGKMLGAYGQQDQSTGSALGEWAALAAAGFGGLGALGLGPLGGVLGGAGGAGAGAAAEGAAAAGAADIGALGLAEGVYGAGGALGAGVAPGTVGGLAGSTAGFGGLGSVLPAGVGFAAPGALTGAAFDLSTVGGVDPAGLVPSTPQPVEFGGQGLLGEPTFTQSLSGGLEPFVAELPTIGAEATAFGGLPELSALAAGAPVETAFGSFGSGLLAPEAAASVPEVFNAAKDSQAYNAANNITTPVGTTPPATVNMGSLGGTMGTAGGIEGALAAAKQGAADMFTTPNAVTGGGGLLGQASSVVNPGLQWLKDNPTLGRLLLGGATSLLSGAGSSGGEAAAPRGPAKQWNSPLQQGLLSPVQQYAPPAIQQNRPAGLLAQGFQNDGAWRFLGGK